MLRALRVRLRLPLRLLARAPTWVIVQRSSWYQHEVVCKPPTAPNVSTEPTHFPAALSGCSLRLLSPANLADSSESIRAIQLIDFSVL